MPKEKEKLAELRGILRKSGYKATPSRLAILAIIKQSRNPLSAQEIMERLGRGAADPVTVYRTINHLKASSVIRPVDLRHNHAHYELAGLDDHHHLICMHCGRVEDIAGCDVDEMQKTIVRSSKHFSEIRQHSLEFYGVCKMCSRTI